MKQVLICVVLWILAGIPASGLWFAYFDTNHPEFRHEERDRRETLGSGIMAGVFGGPIATVVYFLASGFGQDGMRWHHIHTSKCPKETAEK